MLSDNPENRHVYKSGNVNEHETSFRKTDINYWPHDTCAIVGNSIVNGIDEKRFSMNNVNTKYFYFYRAIIGDKSQLIQPIIKKKHEFLNLLVRTNNFTTNDSKKIVHDIPLLKSAILKSLPDSRAIVFKTTF